MKRVVTTVFLAIALIAPALAQDTEELKKEIEALKKGQADILKKLDELSKAVAARPAPAPARPAGPNVEDVEFDLGENPIKGDPNAPLILVEMTDYQCPFCARHQKNTWPQLEKEYVATGKLKVVTLDMPLESIHKLAFKAAEATHCAEEQGKFWEMHDRLFDNQRALEPWSGHAEALGLDVASFDACMSSGKYTDAIRKDMATSSKAGARGTPSFLLAKTQPGNPTKITGITSLRGAQPFTSFKAQIDRALSEVN